MIKLDELGKQTLHTSTHKLKHWNKFEYKFITFLYILNIYQIHYPNFSSSCYYVLIYD